ncbi:MAG TPA: UPF0280 family protein [Thermoplasmata archaeon]
MSEFVLAKVEIEETAATIAADRTYLPLAVDAIKQARRDIERHIRKDRFFLTTLEPYDLHDGASDTVMRMCKASKAAGVGPMATVAGAIAQVSLEAMVRAGCRHGWVDNGGDVALILEKPVTLEVFSQPGADTATILELEPTSAVEGICTSSGRLGHSISFGNSDATVSIAKDAILADALATAIGNRVRDQSSLATCFDDFKSIDGFIGGLVLIDGKAAMYGTLPRIVEGEHNPDRVTAHTMMASSKYLGGSEPCTEAQL